MFRSWEGGGPLVVPDLADASASGCVGRYGESVPILLSGAEMADTKPQAGHAQSRLVARHPCVMKVSDPLVLVERSTTQAGLRGWAVAAAVVARLHELGRAEGIDVAAILGPVLLDLTESELEALAAQMTGPLMDTPRCLLGRPVRGWQAERRFGPERTSTGD